MAKKNKNVMDGGDNLNVVKTAGMVAKKHDKTINRKAGLRDEKKSEKKQPAGIKKVTRRKPLAVKHIRRMRKAAVVIGTIAVAGLTVAGYGFFNRKPVEEIDSGFDPKTVCLETPKDGKPTDYSAIENVGFMNHVLKNRTFWSSHMTSAVHTIMEQAISTEKYFSDGVLVSADITTSTLIKSAKQYCTTADRVMWRSSAGGANTYNGMDTPWSDNLEDNRTIHGYKFGETNPKKEAKGLPPSEFAVYIINENTYLEEGTSTTAVDNGDGTYSVTLHLNGGFKEEEKEKSATYFYRYQMCATGKLDALPTFSDILVTYTFTEDWTILKSTIQESYTAVKTVPASCTAESETVYVYDDEAKCREVVDTYYNGYFVNYLDAQVGEVFDLGAADCLTAAFGNVLVDGATFRLSAKLGNMPLDGVVYVGMTDGEFSALKVALGGIRVDFSAESGEIYIADGGKAKYKLSVADISLGAATAAEETEESGGGLDINDILKQLGEGKFEVNEEKTRASLNAELSLFGLTVPLNFNFDLDGKQVSLGSVSTSVQLGDTALDAALCYGSANDVPEDLSEQEKSEYIDVMNGGITLAASVTVDKLTLNGNVYIGIVDGKLTEVRAKLGDLSVYYETAENVLYISDGNNAKIKLNISALPEMQMPDLSGFDLKSLLNQVFGSLSTSESGIKADLSLNLFNTDISANVIVKLIGGLGVDLDATLLGKNVKISASFADSKSAPAALTAEQKSGYIDVMNGGITLAASITVDKLTLSGNAYIGIADGKLTEVRAKLGDFSVYYATAENVLYISDGNNAKIKLNISALPEMQTPDMSGFDLKGLLNQILGSLSTNESGINTSADLKLFGTEISADVTVKLIGGIGVDINGKLSDKNIKLSASFADGKSAPAALTAEQKSEYVDVMNGGITLAASVTVDNLTLSGNVFIGIADGKLTEIRARLGDLSVYYETVENILYISDGNSLNIKLDISALPEMQMPDLSGFDLKGLLNQVLNNLNTSETGVNTKATLNVLGTEISADVVVKLIGGIGVDINGKLSDKNIKLSASFADGKSAPAALTTEQKAQYVDVVNDGFNIRGTLSLNAGEEEIILDIDDLSLKFNRTETGLKVDFAIKASLIISGIKYDIYVTYIDDTLTVVYGDNDNNLGFTLNGITADGDLASLKAALVETYNRISAVLDEIITNNPVDKITSADIDNIDLKATAEKLKGLLEKLGVSIKATAGLESLTGMLGITTTNGKVDFASLINGLSLYVPEGKFIGVALGKLAVELSMDEVIGAQIGLELADKAVCIKIENATISKFAVPDLPINKDTLLTAADFADMLDYVAASCELLVEDEYSISADVDIYEGANKSYDLDILFEYVQGKEFPVKVTVPQTNEDGSKQGLSISIANDMYWHLGVDLVYAENSQVNEAGETVKKDNLYLDLYILDANPNVGSEGATKGKTVAGETVTDSKLDIYMSVSKYAPTEAGYDPLKIYAPVDEVLTVLAAGVSLLDLKGIDVSAQSEVLQQVIDKVTTSLYDALVMKYLSQTHSQFESLGSSLIRQLLGVDLNGLVNKILSTLSKSDGKNPVKAPVNNGNTDGEKVYKSGNYIKSVGIGTAENGDKEFKVKLNSAAIYGAGYEDIVFSARKNYAYGAAVAEEDGETQETAKSYITGATLSGVYFGTNNVNKLGIDISIAREVNKQTAFEGYYNFSGIDSLLKAVVNSATHSKENATDREKEICGMEEMPDYILNHYFYIEGRLSAVLNVMGDTISVPIDIDLVALSVTIDEVTNEVALNVRIHYNAVTAGAVGAKYIAINGETYVDLTIKGGMLYVKRTELSRLEENKGVSWSGIIGGIVGGLSGYDLTPAKSDKPVAHSTPVVSYRAIPLATLNGSMDVIMDHVAYILNLDSKIVDIINKSVADSAANPQDPVSYEGYDYGKLLGTYLTYFIESADDINGKVSWILELNGKFLTDMLGMGTSSPIITLTAEYSKDANGEFIKNENGDYVPVITDLTISPTVITFVESPSISMTLNGSFGYGNPQLEMREGFKDETADVSGMWEKMFGCGSEEITKTELWSELCTVLGKNYVGIDNSASAPVKLGNLKYNLDGKFLADGGEVLYGTDGIYSNYTLPEVAERTGYDVKSEFDPSTVSVNYSYVAKRYDIKVESEVPLDNAEFVHIYDSDLDVSEYIASVPYMQYNGHKYMLGAFEIGGAEYTRTIPYDVLNAAALTEEGITLKAVWGEVYSVALDLNGFDCADEAVNAGFKVLDGEYKFEYIDSGNSATPLAALGDIYGFEFDNYYYISASGERVAISEVNRSTANYTIYPNYRDIKIYVTLESDINFTYNGINAVAFDGGYKVETYLLPTDSKLKDCAATEGYSFFGWWHEKDGAYARLSDVLEVAAPGETVAYQVKALWGKASLTGYGTFKHGTTRYYNMTTTASYEFKGFAGLVEKIKVTGSVYTWHMDDGGALKHESGEKNGNGALTYKFDQVGILFLKGCMTNWKTTCKLTFELADGSTVSLDCNASGKLVNV